MGGWFGGWFGLVWVGAVFAHVHPLIRQLHRRDLYVGERIGCLWGGWFGVGFAWFGVVLFGSISKTNNSCLLLLNHAFVIATVRIHVWECNSVAFGWWWFGVGFGWFVMGF